MIGCSTWRCQCGFWHFPLKIFLCRVSYPAKSSVSFVLRFDHGVGILECSDNEILVFIFGVACIGLFDELCFFRSDISDFRIDVEDP